MWVPGAPPLTSWFSMTSLKCGCPTLHRGSEGWAFELSTFLSRHNSHLDLRPFIQLHRAYFTESIRPVAAPRPQLRRLDQSPPHRVLVHVLQLLDPLLLAPHVKVVIPLLPEVFFLVPQPPLPRAPPRQQAPRRPLLQYLQDGRDRAALR